MSSHPETSAAAGAMRAAIDPAHFPWIRPLVTAYSRDFASVASLFAGNPAEPSSWRDTIDRVQRAPRDRAQLSAILARQLTERDAPAAARAAAAELGNDGTVAVITGQQAGLFGGPLYTLLKAVTAIQLARQVRETHGVAAVPVFWVDSEDHDWEEVRTAKVLDSTLSIRAVTLGDLPGGGAQPVANLVLDGTVTETISALADALPVTEFTSNLLTRLGQRYRSGARLSTAFAGWIEDLLGEHGLVVFEAFDPAAKPLVADLFERELAHPSHVATLARRAGDAMARLGHQPQVEPAEDAVALFYLDEHGRRAIKRKGHDYAIAGTVRDGHELCAEARQHPERFSPNVLLRPLVQDRLFPTVCYVAGPSELAYQAQLGDVYRAFEVEMPLLYSRASVTLLDSAAARFLERHRVPLEELHAQDESALNKLLESQLPPTIERALDDADHTIAEHARAIRDAVVPVDPTLSGAVDTTLDRMRETLKSLRAKIVQASKRKDETLRRQFQHTRALTFPGGHPQERTVSVPYFANRYGPALCARLIDVLPLDTGRHYLLTL